MTELNDKDNLTPGDEPRAGKTRIKLRLDVEDVVKKRADAEKDDSFDSGFNILYEDNHIIVVVKPQNIPTQADSSGDTDILNMIKSYLIKKYNKPGDAYVGLLHRLDRPTGGVMVFAKTSKAASRLSDQIRSGEFEKTYCAVTSGRPNSVGRVEHYLIKDEKTNTVTLAPFTIQGVKRAVSDITILDEKDGMSLVNVQLITGRTHQARVQLKALSSPIVGDVKYAGGKLIKSPHLALWAYRLSFSHPVTNDILTFLAQPPDEFPWTLFDIDSLVDTSRPTDRGYNK